MAPRGKTGLVGPDQKDRTLSAAQSRRKRMADTRALRVIVGFDSGEVGQCGAIEHDGAVWLVPKWLPFPEQGYTQPERMIRLDQFRYQTIQQPADADYG